MSSEPLRVVEGLSGVVLEKQLSPDRPSNIYPTFLIPKHKELSRMKEFENRLEIYVTDSENTLIDVVTEFSQKQDSYFVTIHPPENFHTGTYRITGTLEGTPGENRRIQKLMRMLTDEESQQDILLFDEQFFWGEFILNTDRSTYLPGQTALVTFSTLDTDGSRMCNLTIEATVEHPDASETQPEVIASTSCDDADQDYTLSIPLLNVGTYQLNLQSDERKQAFSITVQENPSIVDIIRTSIVRSKPGDKEAMTISLTPTLTFVGEITERVPANFIAIPMDSAVITSGGGKNSTLLSWRKRWEAGKTYDLSYTFTVPTTANDAASESDSARLSLFGPLKVTGTIEKKSQEKKVVLPEIIIPKTETEPAKNETETGAITTGSGTTATGGVIAATGSVILEAVTTATGGVIAATGSVILEAVTTDTGSVVTSTGSSSVSSTVSLSSDSSSSILTKTIKAATGTLKNSSTSSLSSSISVSSDSSVESSSGSFLGSLIDITSNYLQSLIASLSGSFESNVSYTEPRQWQYISQEIEEILETTIEEVEEKLSEQILALRIESGSVIAMGASPRFTLLLEPSAASVDQQLLESLISKHEARKTLLSHIILEERKAITYALVTYGNTNDSDLRTQLSHSAISSTLETNQAMRLEAAELLLRNTDIAEGVDVLMPDNFITDLIQDVMTSTVDLQVNTTTLSSALHARLSNIVRITPINDRQYLLTEIKEMIEHNANLKKKMIDATMTSQKKKSSLTSLLIDTFSPLDAYIPLWTATIKDSEGQEITSDHRIEKGDSLELVLEQSRSITPGIFTVEFVITNPFTFISKQFTKDIAWGTIAMNFDKDTYGVDDKAEVHISTIDCPEVSEIHVQHPNGTTTETQLDSTNDCTEDNGNDFHTLIDLPTEGTYVVRFVSDTHSLEKKIDVSPSSPFTIKRTGPTHLMVQNPVPMQITITFTDAFEGSIIETVPEGVTIEDITPEGNLSEIGNEQEVLWKGSWEKDEEVTFTYMLHVPKDTIQAMSFGPLRFMTSYTQIR